jgi:hypothetical protein
MIGAVYLSPAAVVVARKRTSARVLIIALAASAGSLAATVIALYAGPGMIALSISTAAFVVASAVTAALAVAWVAGKLR